jgi:hypothetical protein
MDNFKKDNLRALSAGLKSLVDKFDMSNFVVAGELGVPHQSIQTLIHNCGAAACAVGYGPTFGIRAYHNETWDVYAERVFVDDVEDSDFNWMFAGEWSEYDNTPQGAAKRIDYFLAYGIPDHFDDSDAVDEWFDDYKNSKEVYANIIK